MNTEKEIDFLRTYKDFIYYFNLLDSNIGLSIRYCLALTKPEESEKWLTKSFDKKITKVLSLAKEGGLDAEFKEWHINVEECRILRNAPSAVPTAGY